MAPHTISTTVTDRQLGKNHIVALLQIVHLLQRLQQTTILEYRCLPLNVPRTLVGTRFVLLTGDQLLDTRDICCSPHWPATTATNDSVNR